MVRQPRGHDMRAAGPRPRQDPEDRERTPTPLAPSVLACDDFLLLPHERLHPGDQRLGVGVQGRPADAARAGILLLQRAKAVVAGRRLRGVVHEAFCVPRRAQARRCRISKGFYVDTVWIPKRLQHEGSALFITLSLSLSKDVWSCIVRSPYASKNSNRNLCN